MNCAEKLSEPASFSIYTPSHHKIQAWKVLVAERFKSNFEFRYQIIVSSIKSRKCFANFMIPITLFKKFLS